MTQIIKNVAAGEKITLTENTQIENIGEGAHITIINGSLEVLNTIPPHVTIQLKTSKLLKSQSEHSFFPAQVCNVNPHLVVHDVADHVQIFCDNQVTVKGKVGNDVTIRSLSKNIDVKGAVGERTELNALNGKINVDGQVGKECILLSMYEITCGNVGEASQLMSHQGFIACANVESNAELTANQSIQAMHIHANAALMAKRAIQIHSHAEDTFIHTTEGVVHQENYLLEDVRPKL